MDHIQQPASSNNMIVIVGKPATDENEQNETFFFRAVIYYKFSSELIDTVSRGLEWRKFFQFPLFVVTFFLQQNTKCENWRIK